jgi:hypothetical protein
MLHINSCISFKRDGPHIAGLFRCTAPVALIIASTLIVVCSASAEDKPPPSVKYWHVWTDGRGVSHQSTCEMRNFELRSIEPPASPQWLDRLQAEGASVVISVLPPGWIGTWHENPKPQWIVPLSGRWFVQTMDGTRVEMGPGDLSFGGDQLPKPDTQGHKGHLSGSIGTDAAVLMIVQLKEPPTSNDPCHYK